MRWRTIILVPIIAALGIFIGQNWDKPSIVKLGPRDFHVSLLVLTLIAFAAGVVCALIVMLSVKLSKSKKIRVAKNAKVTGNSADNVENIISMPSGVEKPADDEAL
jgi:uncharacterized integral membrane protein